MGNVDTAKKVGSGPQLIWKRKSAVFDTEVKGRGGALTATGSASIKLDCSDAKISRLYLLPTNMGNRRNEKKKRNGKKRKEIKDSRDGWEKGNGEGEGKNGL